MLTLFVKKFLPLFAKQIFMHSKTLLGILFILSRNFLKDKLEKYAQSMGYGNEAIEDDAELTGLDNN